MLKLARLVKDMHTPIDFFVVAADPSISSRLCSSTRPLAAGRRRAASSPPRGIDSRVRSGEGGDVVEEHEA
jgi:hypothetical protein